MEKWKENMSHSQDIVVAYMWNLIEWTDKQVHTLDLMIDLVKDECSSKAVRIHKEREDIQCKEKETIRGDEMSMKTSDTEASTKTELVVKIDVFPQILSIVFDCLKNIPTKKESVCYLLIFMFAWFTCPANCQIQFEQLTYPIEFGGNATFVCSIVNSDRLPVGRYAWRKNSNIISRGNTSLYPNKYTLKLQINHTGLYYELTIVAFNYSDVNSFYKCDMDFKSVERLLSLDADGFIGKPEVIENNISNEICSSTSPSIILQHAYPMPVCQLHYEGLNYTDYINISSMQEEYAYRIEIDIRKLPCEPNCNGEIDIICDVGIRVYTVIKQKLNGCTGSDVFHPPVYVVIIIVCCIIIMLHGLCNAILVCKDRLPQRQRRRQNADNVPLNMNPGSPI